MVVDWPLPSTNDVKKNLSSIFAMAIEPTTLLYVGVTDRHGRLSHVGG